MPPSTHTHPNALINRLIQYGALIIVIVMLLAALLLLVIPAFGAPSGFSLGAILLVLLALPVLMLTVYAPAVSVDAEAITLHPVVWRERRILWGDIEAVEVFPLLPSVDSEVTRRFAVGKRNYRPASGIMLVIPALGWPYRIAGFFAGAQARPVIALTNRAHTDYDTLLQKVLNATDPASHSVDLLDEINQ